MGNVTKGEVIESVEHVGEKGNEKEGTCVVIDGTKIFYHRDNSSISGSSRSPRDSETEDGQDSRYHTCSSSNISVVGTSSSACKSKTKSRSSRSGDRGTWDGSRDCDEYLNTGFGGNNPRDEETNFVGGGKSANTTGPDTEVTMIRREDTYIVEPRSSTGEPPPQTMTSASGKSRPLTDLCCDDVETHQYGDGVNIACPVGNGNMMQNHRNKGQQRRCGGKDRITTAKKISKSRSDKVCTEQQASPPPGPRGEYHGGVYEFASREQNSEEMMGGEFAIHHDNESPKLQAAVGRNQQKRPGGVSRRQGSRSPVRHYSRRSSSYRHSSGRPNFGSSAATAVVQNKDTLPDVDVQHNIDAHSVEQSKKALHEDPPDVLPTVLPDICPAVVDGGDGLDDEKVDGPSSRHSWWWWWSALRSLWHRQDVKTSSTSSSTTSSLSSSWSVLAFPCFVALVVSIRWSLRPPSGSGSSAQQHVPRIISQTGLRPAWHAFPDLCVNNNNNAVSGLSRFQSMSCE